MLNVSVSCVFVLLHIYRRWVLRLPGEFHLKGLAGGFQLKLIRAGGLVCVCWDGGRGPRNRTFASDGSGTQFVCLDEGQKGGKSKMYSWKLDEAGPTILGWSEFRGSTLEERLGVGRLARGLGSFQRGVCVTRSHEIHAQPRNSRAALKIHFLAGTLRTAVTGVIVLRIPRI